MISLISIVAIGFLLGMRHATDPDHVIAVSTIVSREGSLKRASMIGIAWGVGHTLTILVVGALMIAFRVALPPRLGLAMELAVGLMLILLGVRNLRGFFTADPLRATGHHHGPHYHAHGDYIHVHPHADRQTHAHEPQRNLVAKLDGFFKSSGMYQCVRPLIIGVVHGLAGSAAIALLVLTTIRAVPWAVAYLFVFGIGTVLGMMLITLAMGSTFAYAGKRLAAVGRHLAWAAGAVSLAFGLFIAYRIGFVEGLFRAQAHWIPR